MQAGACRFCYANNPCIECLNLDFYNLLSPPLERPVPLGSGEGKEARPTFNHRKLKQNAPNCRFCNLLLRSVEIADEYPEHVVPLYRWTVGQTLRLQQTGFDVKYEYGVHPGLELYTTTGEFSIDLRLG